MFVTFLTSRHAIYNIQNLMKVSYMRTAHVHKQLIIPITCNTQHRIMMYDYNDLPVVKV